MKTTTTEAKAGTTTALGTTGERLAEARGRLNSLLARHAHGEHEWAWTGRLVDVDGDGHGRRLLGCMLCPAHRLESV